MTTEEGNKLIAEFMTIKRGNKYLDLDISVDHQLELLCSASELQFHLSWDWLMPVVEKIEKLGFDFCVMSKSVFIRRDYDYWETYENEPKIDSAWLAIVEFIKWYNKNKQKAK